MSKITGLPIDIVFLIATADDPELTVVDAGNVAKTCKKFSRLLSPSESYLVRIRRRFTIKLTNGRLAVEYLLNDKLHREDDLPASSYTWNDNLDYCYEWYQFGLRHRENDQPAIVSQREKQWYHRGRRHRDNDQPAIIWPGEIVWHYQGKRGRPGTDLPSLIQPYNISSVDVEWYSDDQLHRENDKPAVISGGGKKLEYYMYSYNYKTKEVTDLGEGKYHVKTTYYQTKKSRNLGTVETVDSAQLAEIMGVDLEYCRKIFEQYTSELKK